MRSGDVEHARRTGPRRRRPAELARLAAEYVTEMTGKESEGITSMSRTDEGRWQIDVEVLEMPRVPDSTDILAVYRAELSPDGDLVGYQRVERYPRGQVGGR
jgi:hypothetical protein